MKLIDKFKIKRNPQAIELSIKNPSSELIEYAIKCGYKIGWLEIEKFKTFCSNKYFLEKFKKDENFLELLKKADISIDLKSIYEVVFENNSDEFLNFYKNSIIKNFKYFSTIIDTEILYNFIIKNFNKKELPQEFFNNSNITSIEENIIINGSIQSIITFLESTTIISNKIITLLENKILNNPTDYFNKLNMIIKILETKKESFSKDFYNEYKKIMIKNPIYTDDIPEFLSEDQEYYETYLIHNPKPDCIDKFKTTNISPNARKIISNIIKEKHIIFDTIPNNYLGCEDIYLEIIKNNNKVSNINDIITNWNSEKLRRLLEYTSYKFNENTPKFFYIIHLFHS